MSNSNKASLVLYALGVAGLAAAGGFWYFGMNQKPPADWTPEASGSGTTPMNGNPSSSADSSSSTTFPLPPTVPANTQVRIDGSTSMVTVNQNLKTAFEQKFAGAQVLTQANGSGQGLSGLQNGQVDLAAVSRPLTAQESAQGLKSAAIATDPVAIVVGIDNAFDRSLTPEQVLGVFSGTITDWSQIGGASGKIRVINRPAVSGTRQVFQDLVMKGAAFGSTAQFTTLERDATTPLLRALGKDGIAYATYSQVVNQKTVRVIAVNQITPLQANYPYGRSLLYVYKSPPSPAVQAFLGYAFSPEGQQAILAGN
jgi:phosphate transport system substrate-binding protein